LKILYLHQYFATPQTNAGTRSYEMARRLVRDGHEVTFVTSSAFLEDNYDLKAGWNELDIKGIKLHVLRLPYSNKDSYSNRIWKFIIFSIRSTIKALVIKADVVFATSTPLTIIIPGVIYSKVKRKPMVFEVRDLWPELPVSVGAIRNPVIIYLAELMEKSAYKTSKKVIALSPGMAQGVIKKGKNPNDVATIPNSCDTELFRVPAEVGELYRKQHMAFSIGKKLVVYAGTFGVINNISYLGYLAKESLDKGYDICFCAIGSGMERPRVETLAKELGVLNVNFFILDPVPKTEIVSVLSAADLALSLFGPIPEMWANSANKMFDALASGTPVAINYQGWQYDLLQQRKMGIFLDMTDFGNAAIELNEFLFDDLRYASAKEQAIALSDNEFSRDKLYQEFQNTIIEATKC
jgi:glycosyltransferase involved in cell wall biosynthesis